MNKLIILGRIGTELELKTVGEKQTSLLAFNVADSSKIFENGDFQKKTIWHKCTAWGKTAENIAKYFTKGEMIFIMGKIQEDQYNDKKTGELKKVDKVIVESFEFVGSGKDPQNNLNPNQNYSNQIYTGQNKEKSDPFSEDDIPF